MRYPVPGLSTSEALVKTKGEAEEESSSKGPKYPVPDTSQMIPYKPRLIVNPGIYWFHINNFLSAEVY